MTINQLTKQDAEQLARAELDTLRAFVHELREHFEQSNAGADLRGYSRKQLLGEVIYLYANNRKEALA